MAAVLAGIGASVAAGAGGTLTPADVCADPDDCRLREAGQIAGVGVGLASGRPGGRPRELLLAEANIGVNHAFSWQTIWPERDRWSFEQADAIHAFHRESGLRSMAFHFAWEQLFLDDLPDWVRAVEDPDELRALLRERAEVIFERYPDLDRINVINEPLPTLGGSSEPYENHFFQVLGPDYIAELFEIVDAAAPDHVRLVLNENFVEYFPEKAEGLVALVADLVQRGIPIDSVGFQTHLMLTEIAGREPDWDLYQATLRRVADLGVDVWISELDNPVDPARPGRFEYQAGNYRRAVEVCLAVPRCSDILVWGIEDGPFWFPLPYVDPAPLLFDSAFEPKPAYFAVRDALLAGRPVRTPVSGDRLLLRDGLDPARRSLSFASRDPAIRAPLPGSAGDPRQAGMVVEVGSPTTGETARVALPPAGWSLRGQAGTQRYSYRDRDRSHGPCNSAQLFAGKLQVGCRGEGLGFTLDEPEQGSLRVEIELGNDVVWTVFGGTVVRDRGIPADRRGRGQFVAKRAPRGTDPGP